MAIKIIVYFLISLFLLIKTTFASSVVINEFMPHPTDNTEWIELYNPTNEAVDLSNWKLKDANTLTSDDLTLDGQISPLSFITFDHVKGWLNDSGNETITLLDNNAQTIDSYTYSGTTQGKTYGRVPDGSNWLADLEPSKKSSNGEQSTPTPAPTPAPTSPPTPAPTPTPTLSPTSAPKKIAAQISTTAPLTQTSTPQPNPTTKNTPLPKTQQTSNPKPSLTAAAAVAGTSTSATPQAKVNIKNEKQINPLLFLGILLIFAGSGVVVYIYLKAHAKIHF